MVLQVFISSFLASLGFAILFNIKKNKLWLAGLGGSIGGVVHFLCVSHGYPEVLALFVAAIAFSLFSEICARMERTPVTTFVICALIPLVPGGGMYRMMVQAISSDAIGALHIGIETLSYAGALVLGIMFVSTITKGMTAFTKRSVYERSKDKKKG